MNPIQAEELLKILKSIREMLHQIIVRQAEEKGEKHSCEGCFTK